VPNSLQAALAAAQTGDAGGLPAPGLPPNFCPGCGLPMAGHSLGPHGPVGSSAASGPALPSGLAEMQGAPGIGAKKKVAARAKGAASIKGKPKTQKHSSPPKKG